MRRAIWLVAAGALAAAAFVMAVPSAAQAADVAQTPYMGWNTYYGLGARFDEATVKSVAGALASSGLAGAGYRIVWLDFGWSYGARDSSGQLTVDPTRWPDGMAGLTAWLHQRGLEAGIYTDAGKTGCNGLGVGSYGHYQQDANTFAAWGFDAVKMDFCGAGQEGLAPQPLYSAFAAALRNNSSGRPMILNVDNFLKAGQLDGTNPSFGNSSYANNQWAPPIAQSWRTDTDIGFRGNIMFSNVVRNLDHDAAQPQAAGPGHWNDPDYLGPGLGMSSTEAQSQFSMWAILAAPLILGSDPRALSSQAIAMLENPDVIAIDQDPLGAQGTLIAQSGSGQVWVKALANGDRAVALFNPGAGATQVATTASAVGMLSASGYSLHDLWSGVVTGTDSAGDISALVPAHGAVLYRVSATGPTGGSSGGPNPQVPVTIFPAGDGFGVVSDSSNELSCPGLCAAAYKPGATVTLTATASAGSAFTGWSGGGCSGSGTCTVTTTGALGVVATFEKLHTLTVSVIGAGAGTVSAPGISCPGHCAARYPDGTSATLIATSAGGSQFGAWLGGGCSPYAASCTLTSAGDTAITVAFDRLRSGVAYVVDARSGTVTPIDLATGVGERAIHGFDRPQGIAISPDGATAYVLNGGSATLTPIDLASDTREPAIGGFTKPGPIAITPDGRTAYVLEAGRRLVPVDLTTREVEPAITFTNRSGVAELPASIAIGRGGTVAYVGTFDRRKGRLRGTVTAVDLRTGRVRGVVRGFKRPTSIAIAPNGRTAYVADSAEGNVTPIRLSTDRVITAPALSSSAAFPGASAVAFAPGGSAAFVADENGLATINTAGNTVGSTQPTGLPAARGLAVAADGGTVYLTTPGGARVLPVDLATSSLRAAITGFSDPVAIVIASPPPPGDSARLTGRPRATRSGIRDRIACMSSRSCTVVETLTFSKVVRAVRGRLTLQVTAIGKRTIRIGSGHALAVTVRLNSTGRRLLSRLARLQVVLVVSMRRHGRAETLTTRFVSLRVR